MCKGFDGFMDVTGVQRWKPEDHSDMVLKDGYLMAKWLRPRVPVSRQDYQIYDHLCQTYGTSNVQFKTPWGSWFSYTA